MVKKQSIKATAIILVLASMFLSMTQTVQAAIASYDLKKTSNSYNTTGTVSLDKTTSNQYTYSVIAKSLPSPLPASGVYYLLWGLQTDGRASNFGPITNDSEVKGTLSTKVSQFFITSEKERYPEFVSGPRIVQTDTIPDSVYASLATPAPTSLLSNSSPTPRPSSYSAPTGAPETGLGGAALLNLVILTLGTVGVVGLSYSLAKRR